MRYSTRQTQGITRFSSERVRSAYERVPTTAWTRSNEKPNAFEREAKRVRTRSQTRSNEKPNAFKREAKRVRTRSQTRSYEKPNTFQREGKRVRARNRTRSLSSTHWFQLYTLVSVFNKNNVHMQRHPTNACVFSACSGVAVRGVAFD